MGRVNCDHIKRLITLTSVNIKLHSLYSNKSYDFDSKNVKTDLKEYDGIFNCFTLLCFGFICTK